jgi:hypothetical protein
VLRSGCEQKAPERAPGLFVASPLVIRAWTGSRAVDRAEMHRRDYDAGRKVCRAYHGSEVTPISCSEPSNSGESVGPEALN